MILNISGNLGLVEQEDNSFRPYVFYRVKCTDLHDTSISLRSVFQIKYDKGYKLKAKVNDFIDVDILSIDKKIKKDFVFKWLTLAEGMKGFYLSKDYYCNNDINPSINEEKFVHTPVDYFFGVKCAVDCINMRLLVGI